MRPLPDDKLHAIVHTFSVPPDKVDEVAKLLKITDQNDRNRLSGAELHIAREATPADINNTKPKTVAVIGQ